MIDQTREKALTVWRRSTRVVESEITSEDFAGRRKFVIGKRNKITGG
ncbi:hypothetical protein [Sphingobium sp.]|nr:hypothetical protein [Sphingobium sp.]